MSSPLYSYFDETYFQDGEKRGTAYVNYKEGARNSPTFREIAAAVQEVFQPQRVLEIGCATGNIVRHLNELGCEAHGIDVSEWAVRNAEHPNVRLASADALPYPDGYFDLVISCHALEHLPDAVFVRSLSELTRVNSAFQFHMLPIVGIPPYDGDPSIVREQLRKDPTHQQLHSMQTWLEHFNTLDLDRINTCILLNNETSTVELSTCQFIAGKRSVDPAEILRRATGRNQRIYRAVKTASVVTGAGHTNTAGTATLSYGERIWKDVERRLSGRDTINLVGRVFNLVVIVEGRCCSLRFAAGQDLPGHQYAHVAEFQFAADPGCNVYRFTTDQMRILRGTPDYSRINHVAIGGENENSNVTFYFGDQRGTPLLTDPQ